MQETKEPRSVVTLQLAEQMLSLSQVATVDDARDLINLAEQARVYARQSKLGTAAVNHATIIKVRAERRMADIVDEGQARGEIATQDDGQSKGIRNANTLDELGIEAPRLFEARLLRDGYTDEELESLRQSSDANDDVLSRAALIEQARDATRQNAENAKVQGERVAVLFPIYKALAALATCSLSPAEFKARVLPESAYRISDHIDAAVDWLSTLKEEWS
jgi:hypothetical protein